MGVRGLYHYCKEFLKPPDFKNHKIGIDVSSLLYRFHGDFETIYQFLKPMLQNKLIFIFDGKAPEYKDKELEIRRTAKVLSDIRIKTLKESLNNSLNAETYKLISFRISQLEKENWYLTYETKQNFKMFLKSKNLIYVKSLVEADTLLIDLYFNGIIDAVLSNDMDYLVAGVQTLYVPVKGILKEISLQQILDHEEINIEQFREASILMGIDNIRIFVVDDFSIAASFIRHYGCIQIMKEKQNHLFSDIIDISEIKKRFYPSKNMYTNLKPEHKDSLEQFHGKLF
uniref:XPG N-terminal domain-containing protein n=1 Tax=viral metagenome TaxID=1070528 RepID=A0A6C0D795_9ZZZZ